MEETKARKVLDATFDKLEEMLDEAREKKSGGERRPDDRDRRKTKRQPCDEPES